MSSSPLLLAATPLLLLCTSPSSSLSIVTWNVLCSADEYDPSWGLPLQISLCVNKTEECTRDRRVREWGLLESSSTDVLLLQELEDDFIDLQPPNSVYSLVARSGQCAVLLHDHGNFSLSSAENLPIDGLTGCPEAPTATLAVGPATVTVSSVHVAASLSTSMSEWYRQAAVSFESQFGGSDLIVLGGDYNHNVSLPSDLPPTWRIAAPTTPLSNGTSQHQDDWMGSFDTFFFKGPSSPTSCSARLDGFMPKAVAGYVQGGSLVRHAQFEVSSDVRTLYYEEWEVPNSDPTEEPMSDHLFVEAKFGCDAL